MRLAYASKIFWSRVVGFTLKYTSSPCKPATEMIGARLDRDRDCLFLLSFKALGKLFDDVELILYGIGVMVLSCLLMIRGIWSPLIGNDDVDAYAIWLTAMVSMYGVGPTRCDK